LELNRSRIPLPEGLRNPYILAVGSGRGIKFDMPMYSSIQQKNSFIARITGGDMQM
jgi:hypothetical protein